MKNSMKVLMEGWRRFLNEGSVSGEVAEIFDRSDRAYLEKTLKTRNPGSSMQAGSVFLEPQDVESLKAADWEPLKNKNVNPPAVAFTAPIPGMLGYVPIENLPDDLPVRFQLSHGGAGGKSGDAAEVVAAFNDSFAGVENTTLICGPDAKQKGALVVWTFHPGDPGAQGAEINLTDIKWDFPDGRATIADAKELGFKNVKRVEKLSESSLKRGRLRFL